MAIAGSIERVGTATAVGWAEMGGHIFGRLPTGATIPSLTMSVDSPLAAVPVSVSPLAVPRVGQVQLVAVGEDLGALTAWLDTLKEDPYFSAVDVGVVTDSEGWRVTVTLSISPTLTALPVADEGEPGATG